MTDSELEQQPRLQINTTQVMTGAILVGVGTVIALAGVAAAGTALVAAYRERINQMEVPPSVLARHHWNRAKAAAAVGYGEWRNAKPVQAA
jgi:hypothetical protein